MINDNKILTRIKKRLNKNIKIYESNFHLKRQRQTCKIYIVKSANFYLNAKDKLAKTILSNLLITLIGFDLEKHCKNRKCKS